MKKDSRIYAAGHRGLVGSAIVRELVRRGYRHLLTPTRAELDLTQQASVDAFFAAEKPEYIFLAAARVGGIGANARYPAEFIRDNLLIQSHVIDAAYRHGARKLLFLGSSCIYPKNCPQPIQEESLLTGPLEPSNEPYAVAKIAGIRMCQAYRQQFGFRAICLMPTNLYGPGDNFDLETSHVLPALLRKFHLAKLAGERKWPEIASDEERFGVLPEDFRQALDHGRHGAEAGPTVVLWGTGSPRREFLHVDDLAAACVFAMENYDDHLPLNVGVGEDLTIRDLAERARRIVGFHGDVRWDSSRPDGTPRKLLDVSRLSALGWGPSISLEEGMRSTYRWYCDQV